MADDTDDDTKPDEETKPETPARWKCDYPCTWAACACRDLL